MQKYILEVVVFICGAAVMILELVGSRILAPYLGTSIIVWTSLIGIILGSLSLGYWTGGRLADKGPNYTIFSFIIFISALFIGLIVLFGDISLRFIQANITNIYFGTILAALYLFAFPSILLGMVSPYAVKLKIKDLASSGQTVGNLYAISTIGSIVGTFAAGFLLIPYLGSRRILVLISIILIFATMLAFSKKYIKARIVFILIFILGGLFLSGQPGLIDIDTQYNRIWIFEANKAGTNRPIRKLVTAPRATQSAMFLDNSNELVYEYTKFYRLASHFKTDISRSLIIGGAAYSYPKSYLEEYPNAELDVVEIDAKMTELARIYFNLKDNPRLSIYHEDGRTFLNKTEKIYDIVYIDAFSSSYTIPYQLTTVEIVKTVHSKLADDGVVLINVISAIEGEKGKLLRAEYATYRKIFPQVYLFPVRNFKDGSQPQNIMLIALKSDIAPEFISEDQELNSYLKHLWTNKIEMDVPILTDDYAPVDYYIMKII